MTQGLKIAALLAAGFVVLPPPAAMAEGRHVAVIVDTSGSMQGNDPPRYTMQLSKILSDLLDEDDELTIVRMADRASCSAGVSSSLALRLDPSDRGSFKTALTDHTECNTGTYYAAAIRTAIDALSLDSEKKRMLLMLADSGGLGGCSGVLTSELQQLRDSGAVVAAVNIGLTAGAFDHNPAINFTTAARDSQELVEAVGLVYQRFLGAKRVQTGDVDAAVEVEIAPFVREAFLVVAADGVVTALEQGLSNPGADDVDLDFRGGGESLGRDGRRRGYRIVRLLRPAAGRWTFKVPGLSDRAGWMLLQDSTVGARLVSPPTVAQGMATPIEFELYDESTGRRIDDTSALGDLDLTIDHEGRAIELNDAGIDGDRQAGDGILTGTVTFDSTGRRRVPLHLENDFLDRGFEIEWNVVESSWSLEVDTPARGEVSTPVALRVRLRALGDPSQLVAPERIEVLTGGPMIELNDAGRDEDETADDGVYSGTWTPAAMGTAHLDYVPRGGVGAERRTVALEVIGSLRFGPPQALKLGSSGSEAELQGRLDLSSATVRGSYDVEVASDFELGRTVLEADLGRGWEPLGTEPRTLRLAGGSELRWPVRLRVGSCPEGNPAERRFLIRVTGTGASGEPIETMVPLAVEVIADPWWICWWPVLAAALGTLLVSVVVHGFWMPSRFPPRLGLVLSPEEDLEEGFFHPIRAQYGSGAGFYRDARIYVAPDFRLSASAHGALARLRAHGKQVRLAPLPGVLLCRQNADGEWEKLPPGEVTARFGVIYRDDMSSLFFEIRNG